MSPILSIGRLSTEVLFLLLLTTLCIPRVHSYNSVCRGDLGFQLVKAQCEAALDLMPHESDVRHYYQGCRITVTLHSSKTPQEDYAGYEIAPADVKAAAQAIVNNCVGVKREGGFNIFGEAAVVAQIVNHGLHPETSNKLDIANYLTVTVHGKRKPSDFEQSADGYFYFPQLLLRELQQYEGVGKGPVNDAAAAIKGALRRGKFKKEKPWFTHLPLYAPPTHVGHRCLQSLGQPNGTDCDNLISNLDFAQAQVSGSTHWIEQGSCGISIRGPSFIDPRDFGNLRGGAALLNADCVDGSRLHTGGMLFATSGMGRRDELSPPITNFTTTNISSVTNATNGTALPSKYSILIYEPGKTQP
ncbi:MAG: hypothetical protein M1838_000632 [Thelocarpon superellum]|nr:MAG: hypothetical protein M1838_000632 [Thelocarpon superellum]